MNDEQTKEEQMKIEKPMGCDPANPEYIDVKPPANPAPLIELYGDSLVPAGEGYSGDGDVPPLSALNLEYER